MTVNRVKGVCGVGGRWISGAVCIAAAVLLAGAVGGCGSSGNGSRQGDTAAPQRFATWDAFTSSERWKRASRHPVVVIGIDGGNWHFIDDLIAQGRLPNFTRLKEEGATGVLRSVENNVTPPAWTSMFTGFLPERHGIYTFGFFQRDTGEFLSASSDDILVPTVWDAASRAGLKCGVINVPVTYPPHPLNGVMVGGMMTPIEAEHPATNRAYTPEMRLFRSAPDVTNFSPPARGAATDGTNIFLWVLHDTRDDGVSEYNLASLRILDITADGTAGPERAYEVFPTEEFSAWLPIRFARDGAVVGARAKFALKLEQDGAAFTSSQVVFPHEVVYTYPAEFAATLTDMFGFYVPSIHLTKNVTPSLTRDKAREALALYESDDWDLYCYVFSETDHAHHQAGRGAEVVRTYEAVDVFLGQLMQAMPRDATLLVVSDHGFAEFDYAVNLNTLLARMGLLHWDSAQHIDHDRTLVFHNLSYLYVNRERCTRAALEELGASVPADVDPVAFVLDAVREQCAAITDAAGRSFALRLREIPADANGHAPDAFVDGVYDGYICEFWNVMTPGDQLVRPLTGGDRNWHTHEGVYMLWGRGVRRGVVGPKYQIPDVAATVLALLGLPSAADMTGVVMSDALDGVIPAGTNDGYLEIERAPVLPNAARESLRQKLRSLGYIQ